MDAVFPGALGPRRPGGGRRGRSRADAAERLLVLPREPGAVSTRRLADVEAGTTVLVAGMRSSTMVPPTPSGCPVPFLTDIAYRLHHSLGLQRARHRFGHRAVTPATFLSFPSWTNLGRIPSRDRARTLAWAATVGKPAHPRPALPSRARRCLPGCIKSSAAPLR
ncbi:hypothetical protein Kpho02_76510 [Kitasatospora phosalacinea]|uniref:Uncharacterized protein n=1 Tax=Kitasatospora phosalacinea TaxID=2065 RepID=A0A9W6QHY8_9ACTN|nr:hypothetical protein Kpho02_76510 [Kitasatospora phosalacinea]